MSSVSIAATASQESARLRGTSCRPLVTFGLIMVSVSVMFSQILAGQDQAQQFSERWGLIATTWEWTSLHSVSTLLTHQFLHGNAIHFLGNMILLLIAGAAVEQRLGSRTTLLVVLTGGMLAGYAHLILNPVETRPLIGASGIVAVLLGMALITGWHWQVPIRIWPGRRELFSIPLRVAMLLWLIVQLYGLIGSISATGSPRIAYISHLTGFAFGAACLAGASIIARRRNQIPVQTQASAIPAGD